MSETVMELLSSIKIVGISQCKFSASFRGDCHKYAMQCSKCNRRLHHDAFSIMDLLRLAPRLILDHFGLGTSSWSTDVIERLQSGGSSEWQSNPASILFSSAEAMKKSLQDMGNASTSDMRIVRCQFGFGLDHKTATDVEKDRIVQINQTDALKMDMGMKDKNAHFDKIRNTHAVLHCLFEILSPGYNRYLHLYGDKIGVYMANEFNYLSDPNDKCKWTLGKSFDRSMDPDRIHPRITRQKASAIELEDEVIKHSPKSIELSLDLVQKWCEFMDETWERNKFLASKSGIKLMKYGGLSDLREKFGISIISKSTKDYFENKLSARELSVEDVLDLKSIQLSREHHLKCVIGDWSCRPSQVIITDIDKSFLDPDHTMGDGWDGIDIDAYFGSTPKARRSREAKMQKICVEHSVKNNAEELLIKEHIFLQTINLN